MQYYMFKSGKNKEQRVRDLEAGWAFVQQGITRLKVFLEDKPEQRFDAEEYMMLYTKIYDMLSSTGEFSQELYGRYRESIEEYVHAKVLPALTEKNDEFMLRELVKRWNNHKLMVRLLSGMFSILDRNFVPSKCLAPLKEVGLTCFRVLVYQEIKNRVKDAMIALIGREREGEQIDLALLKTVVDIFLEIEEGSADAYEQDFEIPILQDTVSFYSRKAASWIEEDSCPDYMLKVEDCLKREKERVRHYLHATSEVKLLEKLRHELLTQYENQLLEKEHSGCHALLRDDKVEDLARMYRLFHMIHNGLEPVGNIFRMHVTEEGRAVVKHAEDAASNKRAEKKDKVGMQEQAFLHKVFDLHDKYLQYVCDCFQGHSVFHQALKEALEVLCNNRLAGSTIAEVLATFCDNLLKEGGSEQSSDEAILVTLEKVVKLLPYISDKDLFAEFYRKKLTRRCSNDKSENDDLERSTLTKLKQQSGGQCMSTLEGMMEDLSRICTFFHRVPKGLEAISDIFRLHATEEGTALVKHAIDTVCNKKDERNYTVGVQAQAFMHKVIELHDKYLQYVNDCFQGHSLFHKALREAFEVFCSKRVAGSTVAELVATFCDNLLEEGGSEKLNAEEIEDTLEQLVKLLPYISDKDVFAEFYRRKLARRLLSDKSAKYDHEHRMLSKLNQRCGWQFAFEMERMVTDWTLAREKRGNFKDYLNRNENASSHPGIDLTVTVLTRSFWPTAYDSSDMEFPADMGKCIEVFQKFYEAKTEHRKLIWISSLGTCTIRGEFKPEPIELIVTTYQAAVLLLFNNADRLSYSDIKNQLNLTDDDVVLLLHSLSCAEYKLLIREPNTEMISPNDWFEFNLKFTHKLRRIQILLHPVDDKKVVEHVDKDRRYAIDASIVRIMKSWKVLEREQLVLKCAEQLGSMFKPDLKVIIKRIEDLIARDYLERDRDNINLFRYRA